MWRGASYADVAYEDFARDEIARLEERRLTGEDDRHEAMLAAGRQPEQAQTTLHSMVVRKVPRRLARGSSSKADAYAWEIGQPGLKKGSGFWLS
jgi:hypothetical protein